jgi:hypothetical protein
VENYEAVLDQVRALGDYARPALQEIVDDEQVFDVDDAGRSRIQGAARRLLEQV